MNSKRKAAIIQLEKYVAEIKSRRPEGDAVASTKKPPLPGFVWGVCTPLVDWTARYAAA